jgi:hypothetical protein
MMRVTSQTVIMLSVITINVVAPRKENVIGMLCWDSQTFLRLSYDHFYDLTDLSTQSQLKMGATTLSITTFSIMTLNIIGLFATLSVNDTQHTQHNSIACHYAAFRDFYCYAEWRYAVCRYPDCRYAECHYAEC